MPVNLIVLAIPVFFLLIALELVITRLLEKDYYRFSDSINDLSTGILQQLVEVFLKTALFAGYLFLYENHRLFSLPASSAGVWIACLFGVDFLYYWFHRKSHEVNAFWAAHVVHHQSEEYNLAVALRQGAFQGVFSWVFYLPLALLGFPPLVFLAVSSVDTLYQFWIHTRAVGRLGPLEWVLNTPSHHRVHHGRNPKYIDRNHAGIFIIWDRMFGTYRPEEEEPVYGITTPLNSWNPVWANFTYWAYLFGKARRTHRLADKVRMFLKPPGWHPEDLGGYVPAPDIDPAYRKYETSVPTGLALYVLLQFVVVLVGVSLLLFQLDKVGGGVRIAATLAVVLSLVIFGGLFERRGWAFVLEGLRLLGLGAFAFFAGWYTVTPFGASLVAAVASVAMLGWLLQYRGLPSPPDGARSPAA